MAWVQVRKCDGACCKECPRWPEPTWEKEGETSAKLGSCLYFDTLSDGSPKCLLIADETLIPKEPSPMLPNLTPKEAFEQTCKFWPHNMPADTDTGDCCWKWK